MIAEAQKPLTVPIPKEFIGSPRGFQPDLGDVSRGDRHRHLLHCRILVLGLVGLVLFYNERGGTAHGGNRHSRCVS